MHTFRNHQRNFETLKTKFKINNFLVSLLLLHRLQIFVQGAEEFLQDLDRQQDNNAIRQSTGSYSHESEIGIKKEDVIHKITNEKISYISPQLSFDSQIIMKCDSIINQNQKYNEDNLNTNISSSVVQASNFNNYEEGNHHNSLNFNNENNISVNEYYNTYKQNYEGMYTLSRSSNQNVPNNNFSHNDGFISNNQYTQNYQNNLNNDLNPNNQYPQNNNLSKNVSLNPNNQNVPNNNFSHNNNFSQNNQYTQNYQNNDLNPNNQYTLNFQNNPNNNFSQNNQYTQNYQNNQYPRNNPNNNLSQNVSINQNDQYTSNYQYNKSSQHDCFNPNNQYTQNYQNNDLNPNNQYTLNFQNNPNNNFSQNNQYTQNYQNNDLNQNNQYPRNNPNNNLSQNVSINQNDQYTSNYQYNKSSQHDCFNPNNQYLQNNPNNNHSQNNNFNPFNQYNMNYQNNPNNQYPQNFKNAEQGFINYSYKICRNKETSRNSYETSIASIHDDKRKLQNFSNYYYDFTYQNPLISHEISSFSKYSNVPFNYYSNSITNNGIVKNSQSFYVNSESTNFGNNQFFTQNYQKLVTSSDNCPKLQENNIKNLSKISEINQIIDSAAENNKDKCDLQKIIECPSEKKRKTPKILANNNKKIKKSQNLQNLIVKNTNNKFFLPKKIKTRSYKKNLATSAKNFSCNNVIKKNKFNNSIKKLVEDIETNIDNKNEENMMHIFTAVTIYSLFIFSDIKWSVRIKNNLLIEIYELIKNEKSLSKTSKTFKCIKQIYKIFLDQFRFFIFENEDFIFNISKKYIAKKAKYLDKFDLNSSLAKKNDLDCKNSHKDVIKSCIEQQRSTYPNKNDLFDKIIIAAENSELEEILKYGCHKQIYLQYYLRIFLKIFFSQENYEKSKIIYDTKIKKECEEKAIKTYFSILLRDYSLNLNKSYPKECDLINEFILEYEGK